MPEKSEITELLRDVKEQILYMQELGVEEVGVSMTETATVRAARSTTPEVKFVPEPPPARAPANQDTRQGSSGSRLAKLPSLSRGVSETAETRKTPVVNGKVELRETVKPEEPEMLFGDTAPTLTETTDTIESIRAEIGDCTRCELHTGRTQVVHSTGNFNAELMFVGEAPGADEDEQGFPFVGRAGQLLTKIIEGMGIKREDVFIGNINRCRPPGNRQPLPAETAACRPFLLREVAVVRPKVIVVMGNTATQNLLGIKTPISKLRGNFQEYFGVKVMPTFHPAYLLRDPHKKREVWEDMKKVRDHLVSLK